ncbi:hypothetical protein AWENTII_003037 [Aspergillus wentii]
MCVSIIASVIILLASIYAARIFLKRNPAPLPPGPKGKPIVGNIADLAKPGEQEWKHWLKFKDEYGPISSITVLGQTIVIINEAQAAVDLLEKRSGTHSSRPRMVFAGELVGWVRGLAMLSYSDRLRAYRKLLHRALGTKAAVSRYSALQDVEVRRFLLRVMRKPQDLVQHIRTETGAVILKISYGYTIEPHGNDPLVDLVNQSMDEFSFAATPGKWLVDFMPILKYVPSWFPGAEFKRKAKAWNKNVQGTIDVPYAFVQEQMKKGKYEPSYLSSLLEDGLPAKDSEEEIVIKNSAMSLYAGGADTTVSSLACFFLAMALYPDVQRKAQEEIERVVGTDRLPVPEDQDNLPYINAIVKEVLRWHPVAPMGLPHTSTADDTYRGYHIPKGSMVLVNIWALLHDPAVYHDPMDFKPERFLGSTPEPDPHNISFGYGRRVCPGKYLADATVFLTIAKSLAAFIISKPVEYGKEVDITPEFLPGVISHPAPFNLSIKPRSAKHEELVKLVETEHPWEESHASLLSM